MGATRLDEVEAAIGRRLPSALRILVNMAGGLESTVNEGEPGELRVFGLARLLEEYQSYQQAWGRRAAKIIPFGTVLVGACRLGVDIKGRVLDLTPGTDGPTCMVIAQGVDELVTRLEQGGLYWLEAPGEGDQ